MSALVWLIPIALILGGIGLYAFMWSARSGQFDDLDGAAERIFLDEADRPINDLHAGKGVHRKLEPPNRSSS